MTARLLENGLFCHAVSRIVVERAVSITCFPQVSSFTLHASNKTTQELGARSTRVSVQDYESSRGALPGEAYS